MAESADDTAVAPSRQPSDFTLKKALFEIAIVAVGVLLALLVDEARQSRADRALADEARSALRAEVEENRVRLTTKLSLLHRAYVTLRRDPAAGARLVAEGSNFQIEMTDAAWTLAMQTGALRLLTHAERQTFAYVYTSQGIYNRLLAEEMNHWTAMAAATPDGAAVKLWQAYAQRVARSVCIAAGRIERARGPKLPSGRVQQTCQRYRLEVPPRELYRALGLPMPPTNWRPGADF
jgi:hypothetical protein